ncbi:MAG: autotransporter-associated beta strand repeat-containing protein, partial [Patescibacteria group bacterium]|nr:autotransporter-associated beta strand repeat-containing protein [Patescibacteria group bacterium]
ARIDSVIAGSQIDKYGTGSLILANANSYTGPTSVNVGAVELRHGNALGTGSVNVANGARIRLQGNIAVTTGVLTLNGGVGLQNVAGNNTWNTNIRPGGSGANEIQVDAGSSLTLAGSLVNGVGYFYKSRTGSLVLAGDNSEFTRHMDVAEGVAVLSSAKGVPGEYFHVTTASAMVELTGGITVDANMASGTVRKIYLSGAATSGSLAALNSTNGTNTWNGNVVLQSAGDKKIGAAAGSTLVLAGVISGAADRHLVKIGDGTLILGGVNTYLGNTTIAQGIVKLDGGDNRLPTTTVLTLGSATSGGVFDLNGRSQTLAGLTLVGSGPNRIVNSNATAGTVAVSFANDTTLTGVLGAPGQANLNFTKAGAGKLVLGLNDYTGNTRVNQGVLELTAANQLSAAGELIIAGGALDMGGYNQTVNAVTLTSGSITGSVGTVLTGASFSVVDGTADVVLGGTGTLAKSGSGTVTLSAANTYTGRTTISGGTLALAGGNNRINPDGALTMGTGTVLDLNGNNQTFSEVNCNAGLIDTGGGMLTINTTVVDSDIRNRTASPTTVITGTGGLTKLGSRILHMGGPSDYTGGTFIREGTLDLYSKSDCLPTTGDVYVASGAILNLRLYNLADNQQQTIDELSGAGTVELRGAMFIVGNGNGADGANDFSGRIIDGAWTGGGLTKVGIGTQVLSGMNTYTGPTMISAGTLLVNGALSGGGAVAVDAGATLGGSGRIAGLVGGEGLVSPGASAGILSVATINPADGMDLALEFGQTGSPDYANAAASANDVLRLTSDTPATGALDLDNTIDVYLGVTDLELGDVFRGGIYVDAAVDAEDRALFLGTVAGADYNYYVLGDGNGAHAFGGLDYYTLAEYDSFLRVEISAVAETANFVGGSIYGSVLQFQVVPEPALPALVLVVLPAFLLRRRTRG